MKVLVATNPKMGNPYTRTLIGRIGEIDGQASADIDLAAFWTDRAEGYDIIHVMFPHELTHDGHGQSPEELDRRFKYLKSKGIKIVSTCHNLEPHYASSSADIDAYALTYSNSDMIFHLAEPSMELFAGKYPDAKNVLLYHHVYDTMYSNNVSKAESRRKLNLHDDTRYVLSFGIIRGDDERALLQELASDLPDGTKLWAPSFYRVNKSRNIVKYCYNLTKYLCIKLTNRKIQMQAGFVSHDDLPLYFSAADAVLIPRKKILNSGNLPMAFYFGKPVAGPDTGNVGKILKDTGNFVFDPNDRHSILKAVTEAIEHPETGRDNLLLAERVMSSKEIATQLINYYHSLLQR